MSEGKYCCFKDPKKDYSLRQLQDICPDCGKPYGFPLMDAPDRIGGYAIRRALDRGFYGATYEAEFGNLSRPAVLKVIPTAVYQFFGKDFEKECRDHQRVAADTEHLVDILDAFEAEVDFGGERISCHVAELQYLEGISLAGFLENPENHTARSIAQIAIDLIRLLLELENKQSYHNDLHAKNIIIQALSAETRRAEAIEENIRAVAIDLGSISDGSKSDPEGGRLGDIGEIVIHLLSLREKLLSQPDEANDLEYRLASVLDEIAHDLAPDPVSQRTPDYSGVIQQIQDGFRFAYSPWVAPPPLRKLDESYNAQTLHPWFVPRLLVDPDGQWLSSVSTKGPQVITGVRGCGKTMLLRALQFHARINAQQMDRSGQPGDTDYVVRGLREDGYIGLYVSCTRLLDGLGSSSQELHEPYSRLYLAYAREALRAARHLREVDSSLVPPGYWRELAGAISDYVEGAGSFAEVTSDLALERKILDMLVSLDRDEGHYTLSGNPAIVFPHLAEAVARCASIWANASVLFLLDDVTTRHLKYENITELLSTLLFSNPMCAFKMTTEVQTLELLLRSPGLIETARAGRDYETFDLAAAVNERLRHGGGVEFIAEILQQRANQFSLHPQYSTRQLLGDATLESIARTIGSVERTAREKKSVYHGIRALAALCVGDIGDVLTIYESIVKRFDGSSLPIAPSDQSECFQEYCSRRLYHLNRRGGHLKDFALSFAEASHDLLLRSARAAKTGGRKRLRQYSTLYVRLTAGDTDAQFERLLELTDAGVFVLEGGSDAPRTKTRDSNPIRQFILTYRKLFGLSSYIGLAESDRFELSGRDIQEWLDDPANGKAILTRNLGGRLSKRQRAKEYSSEGDNKAESSKSEKTQEESGALIPERSDFQLPLMQKSMQKPGVPEPLGGASTMLTRLPICRPLTQSDLASQEVETVMLGLGFEQRTLDSAARVLSGVTPSEVVMVRYPEPGYSQEIEELVQARVRDVGRTQTIIYNSIGRSSVDVPKGTVLVDITGLAKSVLFKCLRQILVRDGRVIVAHTDAQDHYPLNTEIGEILKSDLEGTDYETLEAASKIWSGEHTPYSFEKLMTSDADESRRRLICAAASAKHERLLSLLDERTFDHVDIVAPASNTPRSRLARIAADIAIRGLESSNIEQVDSNDVGGMLDFMGRRFSEFYVYGGFDIELALTGSKMHAVACAAACAAFKVAQCWYVRPQSFDPDRFSIGVGETHYFELVVR